MIKSKFKPIATVGEYIRIISKIAERMELFYGGIWYRGEISGTTRLVPGAKRSRGVDEESIVDDFLLGLSSYTDKRGLCPWELYSLMHKHGLPTRLLEWTKSPLAALFFALDFDEEAPRENPATIWVMDPYAFNAEITGDERIFIPRTGFGLQATSELIGSYLPASLRPTQTYGRETLRPMPIAIEPDFSNARLVAQSGCYTVHGSTATPLDALPFLRRHLYRLEIKPSAITRMRADLEQLGFRADIIYSDLDHFAQRIITERIG